MSPPMRFGKTDILSFPRMRGDEPAQLLATTYRNTFSPHARG